MIELDWRLCVSAGAVVRISVLNGDGVTGSAQVNVVQFKQTLLLEACELSRIDSMASRMLVLTRALCAAFSTWV
jgi:elongation factor P hydroxylase